MKSPCFAALIALAITSVPFEVEASPPRPGVTLHDGRRAADAPSIDAHAVVPPAPAEYNTAEEAGIRVVYHPAARDRTQGLLGAAIAARAELSLLFGRDVLFNVEIRIAGAPVQLSGLAPGPVPEGRTVVAYSTIGLVVMSASAAPARALDASDLAEQLRHALAHLALDEAITGNAAPLLLHEGFATFFAGEDASARAESIALAAARDQLLRLDDVEQRLAVDPSKGSLAAAEAADFARFLAAGPHRDRFPALVARLRAGDAWEASLLSAYGADRPTIEGLWRRQVARRYGFSPVFFGALALLGLIAIVALVTRFRRARAGASISRTSPERRRVPSSRLAGKAQRPLRGEVPKVEHDGRWYTLH